MTKRALSRVFIRCDGGAGDGLGHVVRCITLAEAFRDIGVEAQFLTWSPDGVGMTVIRRNRFAVEESPGATADAADLEFVVERLKVEDDRPLVVLDSRAVNARYTLACAEIGFIACLDDDLMRELPCDVLINNNVWADEKDYRNSEGRKLLLGAHYNLVKPAYFRGSAAERRPPLRPRVLLTFGGEDPHDQTSRLLRILRDSLAACDLTVVVGPAHPDPGAVLATASEDTPHADVIIAPDDLLDSIATADLAITAGGTTCYELAAAGVAQAAVVLDDHQELLVRSLAEKGCLLRLGRFDDLPPKQVQNRFAGLLSSHVEREKLGSAGTRLFDGPGAPRIATALRDLWTASHETT